METVTLFFLGGGGKSKFRSLPGDMQPWRHALPGDTQPWRHALPGDMQHALCVQGD